MRTYKSDAVVIGGGLAGICAALELLEAGRSVTILDRDEEENFGGLAKESFGGIFVVGSREQKKNGIEDSPARAFADWCSFAEFGPDDHWPRRWAEAYTGRCHDEVYLWLKQNGIAFFPVPHWIERGLDVPGNSVARFHIVWGTGRELALQLIARLRHHPNAAKLAVHFGHRVEGFTTLMGGISGCSGALEAAASPSRPSAKPSSSPPAASTAAWRKSGSTGTPTGARRRRRFSTARTATPTACCTTPSENSAATSPTSTGCGTTPPACATGSRGNRITASRWCRRARRCGSTGRAGASPRRW
jgi:predicted oxidoreductase